MNELFYAEAVRPILDAHFPNLPHTAALIGWSSEVLGYDDLESTDHNWGPRLYLFLSEPDYERYAQNISGVLSEKLPAEFRGYPTHFEIPEGGDHPVAARVESSTLNHKVDIETIKNFFGWYVGANPFDQPTVADWLTFQEHKLLGATSGRVYHDGLGELEPVRQKFSYYPDQIRLYMLACEWRHVAEEEAFVGRAGFVGDELGSALIAARIVHSLMRICFMMERKYAPYAKWFGTAFSRLDCAGELSPMLRETLLARDWREREKHLSTAYETVARLHNQLGITQPLPERVSKHGRSYMIIHAERFGEAIWHTITDPEVKRLKFFGGSLNQFAAFDNDLSQPSLCKVFKFLYE
ncbi:MAG TPA: DUF4037 domain-containing protein [Pyrinomonadaceae bacterium]